MKIIDGGVTAPKGFQAASTAAAIKYQNRKDLSRCLWTAGQEEERSF